MTPVLSKPVRERINKLICKIFGHKNLVSKTTFKNGSAYTFAISNHWNCMRCGEPTQKVYFSGRGFNDNS